MSSRKPGEFLGLFLYLVSILLILFAPFFFQGKVIVPGDIPYQNPLWAVEPDTNRFIPPQNPLLSDQISPFFVWHALVSQRIQAGHSLPLWNPYVFSGHPLIANMQSALFYPPNLLLNWLSPGVVISIRDIFNLCFAAFFTFLFARTLQISTRGSIFITLAFVLSGPFIVWLGHPLSNVLATLPLLMWAVENLIARPTLRWMGILAIGIGLAFLAGHPETTFHVVTFVALYGALRLITLRPTLKAGGIRIGVAFLGVLLGAAISAIQLVPFTEFLLQSSTLADRAQATRSLNLLYHPHWLTNLTTSVTVIFPNFFGSPINQDYQWPFSTLQNYNEQTLYFGLIPLAMLLGLLFSHPRKPVIWIVIGLALLSIAIAWRLPGFEAINHLPLFSISLNKRLRMIFVFFAAVSSGFGYDAFWAYLKAREGRAGIWYGVAIALGLPLLITLIIAIIKYVYAPSSGFLHHLCFNIFSLQQIRTIMPLLTVFGFLALCGLFVKTQFRNVAVLEHGVLILTAIELGVIAWGYNPMMVETDILPSTPTIETLKAQADAPLRLLAMNDVFWPNYPALFGLESVDGYDLPVDRWYSDLYKAQGGSVSYRQRWRADWPLVDFLNVKFVLTTETLPSEKFNLLEDKGLFKVYENQSAMPRAFMVYKVEVIKERAAWLGTVLSNAQNLDTMAFLEETPPDFTNITDLQTPEAQVNYLRPSENEVVIEVSTAQAGLLVSSDVYASGWQALLDGRPTKIYRANYAFRAVSVPAGMHTVRFIYQPRGFKIGKTVTLGTLLIIAILLLFEKQITQRIL